MKLDNLFPRLNLSLLEAKARIEHPEDMILDGGLQGARAALQILQATADRPQSVSVKFDGSPSLIFGWRGDEFVLTDKAGFGAKGYDGMTTSGDAVANMIMARKMKDTSPQAVASRSKYANMIASLYPILKASVPKSFSGFAQGDLMWVGSPRVVDGAFEFKPNKVLYRVGSDTELGGRIAGSKVGMVIHSVFGSQQDQEPEALRDVDQLGFSEDHGLVIVPHEIELEQTLKLNTQAKKQVEKILSSQGRAISTFLDPLSLTDRNIKALPGLMKSFLAYKAGEGSNDFTRAGEEFLSWLASPSSKASAKMQTGVLEWIQSNLDGYNAVWHVVKLMVDLKLDLKAQIDQQVGDVVYAELDNKPGHEGFVSVTPDGIIKLVHRAEFMKKTKLDESQLLEQDSPRVVFTFMRANPPTRGHHMVVDKVAQAAHGGDYYIFLSQSQDPKKNPLDWNTKQHFAKLMMPRHRAHFAHGAEFANIKTPLLAADWLYNQGYRDMVMVVGSDRVASMLDILNGWNSEEIRNKYHRDPVHIQVTSAGDRDPDAEGVEGISASMVRSLAQNSDFDGFKAAVGLDDASALAMYDAVRMGMKAGATKPAKKVKEGLLQKWFGRKEPKLAQPSQFPPHSSVEKIADWVREWVAYERSQGHDPAKLFDPNQLLGDIWLTIHAGVSQKVSQEVRQYLLSDPDIGDMIRKAPVHEPRSQSVASGNYTSSDDYGYTSNTSNTSQGLMYDNTFDRLLEKHSVDHSQGTIVKLRLASSSAHALADWCHDHKIPCMDPDDLHLTLLFSTVPVPHLQEINQTSMRLSCKAKGWKKLGDRALVLDLDCPAAERIHQKLLDLGGSHSHPDFIAHTSVNYDWTSNKVPSQTPDMNLVFDLVEVDAVDPEFSQSRK